MAATAFGLVMNTETANAAFQPRPAAAVPAASSGTLLNEDEFSIIALPAKKTKDPDPMTGRRIAADRVHKRLAQAGFTKVQIAAVIGNLEQESGLDPRAVNPKSGAYGLMQWLGPRKQHLKEFEAAYWRARPGQDPHSWHAKLDAQTAFIVYEANTTYKSRYDQFRTLTNLKHATTYYRKRIEVPGEWEANDKRRYAVAQSYMDAI